MTDQRVIRLVRLTALGGGLLAVAGSVFLLASGHAGYWLTSYTSAFAVIAVGFAGFAFVVIGRQPRNAAVWTMALASTCGLYVAGLAAVPLLYAGPPSEALAAAPADLPVALAWILLATSLGWGVGFNSLTTFGFLLFPDGTVPSRRWRALGWVSAVVVGVLTVSYAIGLRPANPNHADTGIVLNVAVAVQLLCAVSSLVALLLRFRRSQGTARQQFKWVAWGAAIFVPTFVALVFAGGSRYQEVMSVPFLVAVAALVGAYGLAVGRYRLFDVDVVISRTLVYGALGVLITGVYVGAVVGIGRLVGAGDEPNTGLALGATAFVAVMFQPLRRRLQRIAERLVYGRRAAPHEVLAEFSRGVAAADDSLLGTVARSLVEGTGADRATVWVDVAGREMLGAESPEPGGAASAEVTSIPIEQHGTRLGRLALSCAAGHALSEQDLRLARDVASGLALALGTRLLTGTLERRVEELRESRRRLVAAQDETRRRLERDVHDGAQQQLVALKVKLGVAQTVAAGEGASATAACLDRLKGRADGAVDAMREFARGVYPPLLEAEGLEAAIAAQARRSPVPVRVEVEDIRRYPRDVEATVYFCVVETLRRLMPRVDTDAQVRLAHANGTLTFEITERDGAGGEGAVDLAHVADRVDAADGVLTIDAAGGRGTTVSGVIPVEARS